MFEDQVAFVSGGGSGIGRATALALGARGAKVVVCDRSGTEAVAQSIRDAGGAAMPVTADVAVAADVDLAFRMAMDAYGRLDLAVNCAGITSCGLPLVEQSEDQFDRVIAVNLKGMWLCLSREIRLMQVAGAGAIVNVSSVLGHKAEANCSEYVASKHGVVGLTKSAALENAATGVRINAICPGSVETAMTAHAVADPAANAFMVGLHPIGRIGQPAEITNAILWLLSPQASFVVGAIIAVDGGWAAR